jgi:urease alpha subunit
MVYDLVIKNGTVIDGSGLPRFRADVGMWRGRIAAIGRSRERAREIVDADGQMVAYEHYGPIQSEEALRYAGEILEFVRLHLA